MDKVQIKKLPQIDCGLPFRAVYLRDALQGQFAGVVLDEDNRVVAHLSVVEFSNGSGEISHMNDPRFISVRGEKYLERQELDAPMPLTDYLRQYGLTLDTDLKATLEKIERGEVLGTHTARAAAGSAAGQGASCVCM